MDIAQESLRLHEEWQGKLDTVPKMEIKTREDLALAYTPGVAEPCKKIAADPALAYTYTQKANTIAVVSDGSAVLGLGNIGPLAAMSVMEGKCALFKAYGDVDAYPLCIKSKDTEEIIRTIKLLSGSFGGINLEDISAPRCFEIETRLKQELDIPVFHDDQHGTAIVMTAALINALKLAGKRKEDIKVVINGAGAAGISIAKFFMATGVRDVTLCDRRGIVCQGEAWLNPAQEKVAEVTDICHKHGTLADAMKGADVFVGVSGPHCVTKEMVASMADKAILFPCANPVPEIEYDDARAAGAFVVGTGSSEHPNQINNVLVFPGLFRGALDVRASTVNTEMMLAAAKGIAVCVPDSELTPEHILPYAFDKNAHKAVAEAVAKAAIETGVSKLYKK